jgi:hypothetical protein
MPASSVAWLSVTVQLVSVIEPRYSRIPPPVSAVLPEMVQLVSVAALLAARPPPKPVAAAELPEMVVFIAIKVAPPWELTPPPPPATLPETSYSLSVSDP